MGALDELAAATERAIEETPGLEQPPVEPKPVEPRDYVVLVAGVDDMWLELGTVQGRHRSEALEQAEANWPKDLAGDVTVHLIPGRFWQAITPEEQPPPPPKRKWKGV